MGTLIAEKNEDRAFWTAVKAIIYFVGAASLFYHSSDQNQIQEDLEIIIDAESHFDDFFSPNQIDAPQDFKIGTR